MRTKVQCGRWADRRSKGGCFTVPVSCWTRSGRRAERASRILNFSCPSQEGFRGAAHAACDGATKKWKLFPLL